MTKWQITTEPSIEPVSIADMKLHLRVTHSSEDDLVTSLIKAARQFCEDIEHRAYITQTITWKLDKFPAEFAVPRPKLQSVTSIKYIDSDGNQQTLNSSYYDVDTYSEPGRIALAYGQSWPTLRGDINGVEVVYVAGYGDAATNVPEKTIAAIKLLVGHLHEHRETVSEIKLNEIPMGVKSLLNARVFTV